MTDPIVRTSEPDDRLAVAARHWSVRRTSDGSRWWMHAAIHRHINRLVCGDAIDGPHAGFHRLIERHAPAGGFSRAVSVGCGSGGKEMRLLRSGTVHHFDLFEIGEHRRDQIMAKAATFGVADRVTVHIGDALETRAGGAADLLYWNNALHHMADSADALAWSFDRLLPGGCFAADDFVGPSRFQWTDAELALARRIRSSLPERLLIHPRDRAARLPIAVERPTIDAMLATDPTEAADSDRILDAVRSTFVGARVIATGGVVYHLALNDVLANMDPDSPDDAALLESLLLLDETIAGHGHTHYAVVVAIRA